MSLIATIPASTKQTLNLQNLYEFLVIGLVDSEFNANIELDVRGTNRIRGKATQLKTLNAIGSAGVLSEVHPASNILQVANGGQGNEQVQVTIDNLAETSLNIYGFSTSNNNGTVCKVQESSIVSNSSETYAGFEALIFDGTNLQDVQIEFADGWTDRLTSAELRSLLAKLTPALYANDLIQSAQHCIDNRLDYVKSVRIFSSSGGAVNVLSKSYELI